MPTRNRNDSFARLARRRGIAGADRIGLDARGDDRKHFDIGVAPRRAGDIVHVCRRGHHGRARRRELDLRADGLVIKILTLGDDHMEAIVVILAFAALVIDQMAQAIRLAAVDRRCADDTVIRQQVGDDEPSPPPHRRFRQTCQNFPIHSSPTPVGGESLFIRKGRELSSRRSVSPSPHGGKEVPCRGYETRQGGGGNERRRLREGTKSLFRP